MLKTTKPPRSQKGMRRLLKWYEKKGRPITRTVILYRSEPLARNSIRTQHQALTLGTKRASALGAATLERETRNAKKEQQTRGRLRDGRGLVPASLSIAILRIAEERLPVRGVLLIREVDG